MTSKSGAALFAQQLVVLTIMVWLFAPVGTPRSTLAAPIVAQDWREPPLQPGIVADAFGESPGIRLVNGTGWSPPSLAAQRLEGAFSVAIELRLDRRVRTDLPLFSRWQARDGGRSFLLGVRQGGKPFFAISADGRKDVEGTYREIGAARALPLARPVHLVAVFEPAERMALFVDGTKVAEATGPDEVPTGAFPSRAPVLLGTSAVETRWTGKPYDDLPGVYGPVYVLDRALSDRAIAREAAALGYPLASGGEQSQTATRNRGRSG